MKLRLYKNSDKEGIIKLVSDVLFEIFNAEARNIDDLSDIKNEYFSNNGAFYVAEIDGRIIGVIGVRQERDKVARLRRMVVHKEYRKLKIGQRLLNKVFGFCKSRNYEKIILSTYPQMTAALKFYEKNGFKEFKRDEQIFLEKDL